MHSSLLSYLLVHWERRLLLLLAFAIGAFFFTRSVLENPPPPQEPQPPLPDPPELLPWKENPPVFLQATNTQEIQNPFQTQFPVEKPQPTVVTDIQPAEPPPPVVVDIPAPPHKTITITFTGVRAALTGKKYALLEVVDSEAGASNPFLTEGATLACGISVHDISEKSISLKNPDGEDMGTLTYGENKIFTLEQEKQP